MYPPSDHVLVPFDPHSDGLDVFKIFLYSLFCMTLYRVLAAFKIWQITRKGDDGEVKEMSDEDALADYINDDANGNNTVIDIESAGDGHPASTTEAVQDDGGSAGAGASRSVAAGGDGSHGFIGSVWESLNRPGYPGARWRIFCWQTR